MCRLKGLTSLGFRTWGCWAMVTNKGEYFRIVHARVVDLARVVVVHRLNRGTSLIRNRRPLQDRLRKISSCRILGGGVLI